MSAASTAPDTASAAAAATIGPSRPFRVIIAGGSVIGLTLANALDKAGIDFVVLEKRKIAPELGAAISMLSNTSRVFDQLGVLKAMEAGGVPLTRMSRVDARKNSGSATGGRILEDSDVPNRLAAHTGRPFYFLQRRYYLQALYDNLSDAAQQVREDCGVVSYEELEEAQGGSVRVKTTTGELVEGSILVGCDGVHSTVRGLMAGQFRESDPGRAEGLIAAFTSTYSAIFGTTPNAVDGNTDRLIVPEGHVHSTMYQDVGVAVSSGVPGLTCWFVFVKEEKPLTTPNCARYGEADAEAAVEKYGQLAATDNGVKIRDIWKWRTQADMVPMESGVVPVSWNNGGRVVLLGDSVTKATANLGFGGNTNVEAVCRFVNELVPLVRAISNPSAADLTAAFTRYENKHRPRARLTVSISDFYSRFDTMDGWHMRLLSWLFRWMPDSLKAKGFITYTNAAPKIDYLPDPGSPSIV